MNLAEIDAKLGIFGGRRMSDISCMNGKTEQKCWKCGEFTDKQGDGGIIWELKPHLHYPNPDNKSEDVLCKPCYYKMQGWEDLL